MEHIYDIIILGGGPAGYTAAMYAGRSGLDTLIIEKLSVGGQMALTDKIDNYPGFPQGIDGFTLGQSMKEGADLAGAKTEFAEITGAELEGKVKTIHTDSGDFMARAVILATGADHRHLGLPEEEALTSRGVHYCATCDAMFYRGKTVAVIGGGNTAVAAAQVLSRLSKKVILIHRRDTLRAGRAEQNALLDRDNVEFRWNSKPVAFLHDDKFRGVRLQNVLTGEEEDVLCDGVFVSVGQKPNTELFEGQIALVPGGYIDAGEDTGTSLPGVFAAGDVRSKPLRQIVTAASDGAVAAHMAELYLTAE